MLKSVLESVGQSYQGFAITKYIPLNELQATLIELVHEISGARVIHIANGDPENLFCLSFQTLPYSSNGVAHILEHTVLCGSEKFPIKDPFFAMTRRSLNTFMNALTGQDFTCYPASSQVEKDFYNLLEVYLDSVFHPQLKEMSFLQEGHRLNFVGDSLEFQGVVYNEMKGAMSSIDSRVWQALAKRLMPDLPYAFNSGGDPKEIPDLTLSELIDFHRQYYDPSRALFFFYGNLPLSKHLDFIEKELRGAKKLAPLPPFPLQKRFDEPLIAKDVFPAMEGEGGETQIVFAWLTVPISHQKEILALEVLESVLTDNDGSILTKALLKSGLCTQVESSIDIEMSEIPWIITCKGCKAHEADALQKKLFETLEKARFAAEEIEAALHGLEFERTEISGEGGPFGLTLFMRSAPLKQHGCEPEQGLLIHSLFSELRGHLADPQYLPRLLRKYALENSHFVRLTMEPDVGLMKKEKEEERQRLEEIQKELKAKEKEKIRKQSEALKVYQEEVEHQSIDCLPKVTLKDVPKEMRDYSVAKKQNVFFHSCFTNQILYADLIFDLPALKLEELPLASLFAQILPELGCAGRDYEKNLAYQQRYIGEIDASLSLHTVHSNPNLCRPTFSLRGKALYRNSDKLFQLFADTATSPDLSDRGRVKEWLAQHVTELKENFTGAAMSYASQTSLKSLSTPAFIHEQWKGLSYYQSVLAWEKKPIEKLVHALQEIGKKLLGLQGYQLVISCDRDHYTEIEKSILPHFMNGGQNKPFSPWVGNYPLPEAKPIAYPISAPVAFTSLGMKTLSYLNENAPLLLIAAELMKNTVLHKEIREKGGAYGSGASYTPSSGTFAFFAYRDPHLKRSVDAFYKAIEAIGQGQFNDRELEEAKLGVLQNLDAPIPVGARGRVAYAWARSGRTKELREAFRNGVLQGKKETLAATVLKELGEQKGTLATFLGKELLAQEQKGFQVHFSRESP